MYTRYHIEVLRAENYVDVRLNGDSLVEFISQAALNRAKAKGVQLPPDASVTVTFNGAHITVEIFKHEELEFCMQEKGCGTSTLYWPG